MTLADLSGPRLTLRRWKGSDSPALKAILGDREVMRYSLSGPLDKAAREAWLAEQMATPHIRSRALGCWAIASRSERRAVGYISLSRTDVCTQPGEVELGIRLAQAFWGRGMGKEAAQILLEEARNSSECRRLLALVDPDNTRSVALMRTLGMRFEKEIMLPDYDHPDHLFVLEL